MKAKRLTVGLLALFFVTASLSYLYLEASKTDGVDFNTEVKPILNKKCISCHGGVKKNGGFSLLFEDEAHAPTESGHPAILPGKASESEMIRRILHDDPEERMPPESEPLSEEEVDVLTRWINEGAEFEVHWAYVKPEPVSPPELTKSFEAGFSSAEEKPSAGNEIDRFVLAKLQEKGLNPSPEADRATLLRRLSLDLTGLPPTPEEISKFIHDQSPAAYEKQVNRLLASPHFGEKWASMWLDLARYADSKGYQKDHHRNIWKYRDWVIKAFNEDMPFDQFTIEQLAGDLLPNPTDDQLLATAFHRNTMNNDEGGTDNEEFRVAAVLDRVNTTMEVWQGTTFACVQCHSHPYDPFRHEEYFEMYAFFNNSQDNDLDNSEPLYPFYSEADEQKLDSLILWFETLSKDTVGAAHSLVKRKRNALMPELAAIDFDDEHNTYPRYERGIVTQVQDSAYLRYNQLDLRDRNMLQVTYSSDVEAIIEMRQGRWNGPLLGRARLPSGQDSRKERGYSFAIKPAPGTQDIFFFFRLPKPGQFHLKQFTFEGNAPGMPAEVHALQDSLRQLAPVYMPIMREMPEDRKRESFVFERGNWLVHGDIVQPEVPQSLNAFEGYPPDRMGLAHWLLSKENPLTARVTVNRLWEQLFGYGIVRTLEDFGTQGAVPSHPELLDWLALRFMHEHQWRMKSLIKDMVMSATYRQSSQVTPELYEADPQNKWLARGPRFRLSAEQIRDQALAVSGLLSDKMYGPSVMPEQPEGIWNTIRHVMQWRVSEGEDRYRRALYTYWRRSSPYPSMITFDSPNRGLCVSRRIRTNTPLQALTTLNDPVYFEAAQALAAQAADQQEAEARLSEIYRLALGKLPAENKKQSLLKYYQKTEAAYRAKSEEVAQVVGTQLEATPANAALVMASNVVLNLDEFISKE
ncbi:MAG: DUF1553 domain-containing protein [Cyclobacteriaceae bacterium]